MQTYPHDVQHKRPWPRLGSKDCLRPPIVWQSHVASFPGEQLGPCGQKSGFGSFESQVVMMQVHQTTWLENVSLVTMGDAREGKKN